MPVGSKLAEPWLVACPEAIGPMLAVLELDDDASALAVIEQAATTAMAISAAVTVRIGVSPSCHGRVGDRRVRDDVAVTRRGQPEPAVEAVPLCPFGLSVRPVDVGQRGHPPLLDAPGDGCGARNRQAADDELLDVVVVPLHDPGRV